MRLLSVPLAWLQRPVEAMVLVTPLKASRALPAMRFPVPPGRQEPLEAPRPVPQAVQLMLLVVRCLVRLVPPAMLLVVRRLVPPMRLVVRLMLRLVPSVVQPMRLVERCLVRLMLRLVPSAVQPMRLVERCLVQLAQLAENSPGPATRPVMR